MASFGDIFESPFKTENAGSNGIAKNNYYKKCSNK